MNDSDWGIIDWNGFNPTSIAPPSAPHGPYFVTGVASGSIMGVVIVDVTGVAMAEVTGVATSIDPDPIKSYPI